MNKIAPPPETFVGWHMQVPGDEGEYLDYTFEVYSTYAVHGHTCDACDGAAVNLNGRVYLARSGDEWGVYCHACVANLLWPTSTFRWLH